MTRLKLSLSMGVACTAAIVVQYSAPLNVVAAPGGNPPVAPARPQYDPGPNQPQYYAQPRQAGVQMNAGYSGYGNAGYANGGNYNAPQYQQGRVVYAPAGMTFPVTLKTSISTQAAKPGDHVEAALTQELNLGNGRIPAGSAIIGTVADVEAGRRLGRSGELSIKFNRMRLPDGSEAPINAHIVGGLGKYSLSGNAQSDTVRGETAKNKFISAGARSVLGAGTGAALGTAVGAIASGKRGAGRGAWSGAAIGGGLGLADSVLLRKGADVVVQSGTQVQLQLDSPVSISTNGQNWN